MRRMTRTLLAAAALTASAAATLPAAATADSIAYVAGGDVWLSTGDGARQYRVTASGGYADVTQADDGTLVALNGVRLHRLDRAGNVLADFDTPVSDVRPEGQRVFYGPLDPAISPDGRRLAYTYYYVGKGTAPGCTPPTCMTTVTEGGTGYSHADRQTAWDEPGLGRHSGWRNPTWVDDSTTMISDPTHLPNADVLLDVVGDTGVPIMDWFSDNGTQHLGAGEMTRQRTKLAFQAEQGDAAMRIYRMPGAYPALPEACFAYDGAAGGAFGAPSWSPDGARLAWADAEGVKAVDVPDFAAGCTQAGASPAPRLLIAGASQPDWGPADVPAGPGRTPAGPPTTPPVTPPGGDGPGDQRTPDRGRRADPGRRADADRPARNGGRAARVTVRSATVSSRAIRLGLRLPGAGRLTATARLGRTTIAQASAVRIRSAGSRMLTLRPTAAGRRALARRGAARRLTVRVTFAPAAGGRTLRATRTIAIAGARR